MEMPFTQLEIGWHTNYLGIVFLFWLLFTVSAQLHRPSQTCLTPCRLYTSALSSPVHFNNSKNQTTAALCLSINLVFIKTTFIVIYVSLHQTCRHVWVPGKAQRVCQFLGSYSYRRFGSPDVSAGDWFRSSARVASILSQLLSPLSSPKLF